MVAECIHERPDLLLGLPEESAIVSSLPFLSLLQEVSRPTIALIREFLLHNPRRKLVQYTYGRKEPFNAGQQALSWQRQELVPQPAAYLDLVAGKVSLALTTRAVVSSLKPAPDIETAFSRPYFSMFFP